MTGGAIFINDAMIIQPDVHLLSHKNDRFEYRYRGEGHSYDSYDDDDEEEEEETYGNVRLMIYAKADDYYDLDILEESESETGVDTEGTSR
jgi:hypothetical protein